MVYQEHSPYQRFDEQVFFPYGSTPASAGEQWNPQLHFTGLLGQDRSRLTAILKRFGGEVEFYWYYYPIPGMYSLELQFFDSDAGKAARKAARAEHQKWPVSG